MRRGSPAASGWEPPILEFVVRVMHTVHHLRDRSQILSFLETDRLYAAYAVGDLEPGFFEQCTWAGAERNDELVALALEFDGLEPPALFLMGQVGGLRAILEEMSWRKRVYLTCRSDHLSLAHKYFVWKQAVPMWRMVLRRERFKPVPGHPVRLTAHHLESLQVLYTLGGGGAFSPAQLETGIFYGLFLDGELVAAAGTHLVSRTYGVAAVGNVFVRPMERGHGYGTLVTSAVIEELLQARIPDIVLNVAQDNSAISIYQRLGFECYCPFFEGPASAV